MYSRPDCNFELLQLVEDFYSAAAEVQARQKQVCIRVQRFLRLSLTILVSSTPFLLFIHHGQKKNDNKIFFLQRCSRSTFFALLIRKRNMQYY